MPMAQRQRMIRMENDKKQRRGSEQEFMTTPLYGTLP